MKQPQWLRCLLSKAPWGKGRGAVRDRAARKNAAEPAVSAMILASRTSHLDVLGGGCLCCPQVGTRQRQKAEIDGASCPGTGPEEIKERLWGQV